MLAHYESRLADLLGSRLTAPLGGRVFVTPGPPAGAEPAVLVGISSAEILTDDFGCRRPEVVPGNDDPRRAVRMRCDVRVELRAPANGGRLDQITGLDAVLYELDTPEMLNGNAFGGDVDDPGFLLDRHVPQSVVVDDPDGRLPAVVVEARGWFWPPNTAGVDGRRIDSAHVRTSVLPVSLEPWPLDLRAGAPRVPLTVRIGAGATTVLNGTDTQTAPFGSIAVRVLDAGGRPGRGTLDGGSAGPDGSRALPVTAGAASFAYIPPAAAAADRLVVTMLRPDTGDGSRLGIELARFRLAVAP